MRGVTQRHWGPVSGWFALSLLWGISWLPALTNPELPALAQSVITEEVTEEQQELFAKIVLQVEPYRVLAQQTSLNTVDPSEKEDVRRKFIRKATEIITANGMTVPEYNRITLRIRSEEGAALRQTIEAQIQALQESGFELEQDITLD